MFDDAKAVANAGLVIPLRLADQLGLRDELNRRVSGRDRRQRRNGGDKAMNLVAMILAGGEFISDVAVLASGSTSKMLGYRRFSESRLGEWLRSLTPADVAGFADAQTAATARAWSQGRGPDLDAGPVVVDVDATHTETYGLTKAGAAARNYQGKRGYHPLIATEASTGQIIAAQLRGGNTAPAHDATAFVADALTRLRTLTGDDIPLLVRADSGFYLYDLLAACQAHHSGFSVTVRQYAPTRRRIEAIPDHAYQPVAATADTRIDIAAVDFTVKGRGDPGPPIPCRLIVRRHTTLADHGQDQPRLFDLVDHHAFVTDQPGDPATLWHRHRRRARIEATIRDLKHGLALNHFPSATYTANAAWLHLNTIAHNLCRWTNQLVAPQPLTAKTLRHRYYAIPGRITTGARTTTLHYPRHWPHQHHIRQALTTIHHLTAA